MRKSFQTHTATLLASLCAFILCCVESCHAEEPRLWSRGFDWVVNKESPAFRFTLFNVHQERTELTAEFAYDNYIIANEVRPTVVIQGRRTEDGRFWPNVVYEVRKDSNASWEPVRGTAKTGQNTSVLVKPLDSRFDLFVSLEPFKAYITLYHFARVTLPDGDRAEFELKSLSPPSETP
jgi:hypothetical protein